MLPQSKWQDVQNFAGWDVADPAKVKGNEVMINLAYADTFQILSNRFMIFSNLPLRFLDRMAVKRELQSISNANCVG